MKKAVQEIVESLVAAGNDHVFTLPGGVTTPLINELGNATDRIRVILTRNEQTPSIMANACGRLTGKPGVFIAQGPFAASLGLFGTLESYTEVRPCSFFVIRPTMALFSFTALPSRDQGKRKRST